MDQLSKISPAQIEFLAEDTLITIVPRMSMEVLHFLSVWKLKFLCFNDFKGRFRTFRTVDANRSSFMARNCSKET